MTEVQAENPVLIALKPVGSALSSAGNKAKEFITSEETKEALKNSVTATKDAVVTAGVKTKEFLTSEETKTALKNAGDATKTGAVTLFEKIMELVEKIKKGCKEVDDDEEDDKAAQ